MMQEPEIDDGAETALQAYEKARKALVEAINRNVMSPDTESRMAFDFELVRFADAVRRSPRPTETTEAVRFPEGQWAWSTDEENWDTSPGCTREEAIAELFGEPGYIAQITDSATQAQLTLDAMLDYNFGERLGEAVFERFGIDLETTPQESKRLGPMLLPALSAWTGGRAFFTVGPAERVTGVES